MTTEKSASQLDAEIAQALRRATPGFIGFDSWGDVVAAARRGDHLWYQAALDPRPRSIRIVKVFKNGGIRIDPISNQADNFTADRNHLGSFFRRT